MQQPPKCKIWVWCYSSLDCEYKIHDNSMLDVHEASGFWHLYGISIFQNISHLSISWVNRRSRWLMRSQMQVNSSILLTWTWTKVNTIGGFHHQTTSLGIFHRWKEVPSALRFHSAKKPQAIESTLAQCSLKWQGHRFMIFSRWKLKYSDPTTPSMFSNWTFKTCLANKSLLSKLRVNNLKCDKHRTHSVSLA